MKRFFVTGILAAALVPFSHGAEPAKLEGNFKVVCSGSERASDLRAVTLNVAQGRGLVGSKANWDWFSNLVNSSGASLGPLKVSQMAQASLHAEATLIRKGALVAALMIHDGSLVIPDYKDSEASTEVKRFLVASVSPTNHPDDDHGHEHGDDVRILLDIAKRLKAVRSSMGPFYGETAAKYFIRAHAYRDPVGVEASRQILCSQGLDAEVLRAIGMAAMYVTTGSKPAGVGK